MQARVAERASTPPAERAPRMLARTFFRELQAQGFSERQILSLAEELMELVEDGRSPPRPQ